MHDLFHMNIKTTIGFLQNAMYGIQFWYPMTGTISAMEKDIFSQPSSLLKFIPQKKMSIAAQNKMIFCGSGDSFATCMLAEAHSGIKAKAIDPLDLIKYPKIISDKNLYIVSISGRTVSNIRASHFAKTTVAITSNPKSRLAKSCLKTIHLQFPNSDRITAGTSSFLESALTCISLVRKVGIQHTRNIFESAHQSAKLVKRNNRVFFLGNLYTYPLAMYAAAKTYEITGSNAYYERLEQFSHMELFSAKRGDTAVILEEKNQHNKKLSSELESIGLVVEHPPIPKEAIAQFLFCTFYAQIVPLLEAKRCGQNDCHFVKSAKLRNVSDKMIY
ncbi:MAG: hypothetical protein K8823_576 [Cenarchaeum symbiont of Oopsacas minuta]|nr:hypothetical protein [Cenarchaeum symbiont of Oopsacas minuta]